MLILFIRKQTGHLRKHDGSLWFKGAVKYFIEGVDTQSWGETDNREVIVRTFPRQKY